MRALIIGSTGMVGSEVLAACLAHPAITRVTVVNRDANAPTRPKVTQIAHPDFIEFMSIKRKLIGHDVIFYCVGVYQGAVPEADFARVTLGYLDAFAKTVESRDSVFCLLSAGGANPNSAVVFAKWKGRAEEALRKYSFKRTHFFRPGYIHPSDPARRPKPFRYAVFSALYPLIALLGPGASVTSRQLAHAMVAVGVNGGKETLSNVDIRRIR